MLQTVTCERSPVLSFDRDAFDAACADLMRLASRAGLPDLIIGIPTGGLSVAQSMVKAAGDSIPLLPLTCRRPSSKLKPKSSSVRKLIAGLPRPVLDRLRVIEHTLLTRGTPSVPAVPHEFVTEELAALEAWLYARARPPALLIVDDAVDSGATLHQVATAVREMAPPNATIRSAVITVTTRRPLISPDYALFNGQLCRFPWSMDAR